VTFQCKQGRAQITICKAVVLYMQPMVAVGLQTLQSTKAWLEVWECHGAATQELGEHSCHWLKSEVDSRHCVPTSTLQSRDECSTERWLCTLLEQGDKCWRHTATLKYVCLLPVEEVKVEGCNCVVY